MARTTDPPTLRSMADVVRFNEETGHHFFEPDTLRFFRSRIGETLYGRRFFTTSEKGPDMVRAYSVRFIGPDSHIGDVGGFQSFDTSAKARRVAAACADAGARITVIHDPYPDVNEARERQGLDTAPNPDRFEWRPYITTPGGHYAVGNRRTRAAAEALRAWLLAPRWERWEQRAAAHNTSDGRDVEIRQDALRRAHDLRRELLEEG
jgi:hypothetical protein